MQELCAPDLGQKWRTKVIHGPRGRVELMIPVNPPNPPRTKEDNRKHASSERRVRPNYYEKPITLAERPKAYKRIDMATITRVIGRHVKRAMRSKYFWPIMRGDIGHGKKN